MLPPQRKRAAYLMLGCRRQAPSLNRVLKTGFGGQQNQLIWSFLLTAEQYNYLAFFLINPFKILNKLTKRLGSIGYFYVLTHTE